MEVFRDLFIRGNPDTLASLVNAIEPALTDGWVRDKGAEQALSPLVRWTAPAYCFSCSAVGMRPAAGLFLTEKTPGVLHVSNIVPSKPPQLTVAEYNQILEEFCRLFVRPCAEGRRVEVEITSGTADLERWLSPATAEKLRRFSALANKSTGSAHPADHERWMDFLVAAHRENSELDAAFLRRWLGEIEGWPPEVVHHLVSEYAIGRDVLANFDLRRGA